MTGRLPGAAYPRLLQWFNWFSNTQAGPVSGSFRWRGREPAVEWDPELNKKTFASGIPSHVVVQTRPTSQPLALAA